MKKLGKLWMILCTACVSACLFGLPVYAAQENRILDGIYAENLNLSGMTAQEAGQAIEEYVDSLCNKTLTLVAVNGNEVQITPGDVGFHWSNREFLEEAALLGQSGNVVQRYKAAKDLQYQNKIYRLSFDLDREQLRNVLTEQCAIYNEESRDATLSRQDGRFVITDGQTGRKLDEQASADMLYKLLTENWDRKDARVELAVTVDVPKGTREELEKVQDVLGAFSTNYRTSGSSRCANVRNGCNLINGTVVYPGEEFSTCDLVTPFTAANGYYMAGSYLNGQVVDSLGGGICQVSTTLYNAVLLAELEVTERYNHSMIVTYVDPSADAAIAESSGKDFKFINNTQAPIYIEGYTTDDKQIYFTIYGKEERNPSHSVRYESEIISTIYPDSEVIYTDASKPVGSVSVQSAHIGYKANLWKIVTENGQEVSREMVNSSSYQMVPRYATVGIATEDPNVYNQMMEAIATNSIDHVKNVAAALAGAGQPAPEQAPAAEADPPAA